MKRWEKKKNPKSHSESVNENFTDESLKKKKCLEFLQVNFRNYMKKKYHNII